MALIAESRRNKFYFGTEQRMEFFPTPNRGADVSAQGWSDGGTLLNGGGYQQNSFGSAKNYIFEWPSSSSRQVAQKMKSYADGSYGRGLVYFLDPLTWDTNVLPAMWADPSMGIGYEGASLVYGVEPTPLPTSGWEANDLPVQSAYYNLSTTTPGWRGAEDSVFIPIPPGHILMLGAIYSFTGTGRVFVRTQSPSGALGTITGLTAVSGGDGTILNTSFQGSSSVAGVRIFVGRSTSASSSVTLSAMIGRIYDPVRAPSASFTSGPWIGGQGHSGCRFVGKPTYIENTGVGGGQVSFAASFREVGSWIYG